MIATTSPRGLRMAFGAALFTTCAGLSAQQLNGFDLPRKGRTGVFSPGLIQGYGENDVVPFKANVDAVDLQDAAVRAAAAGSTSRYLVSIIIPTHSDHAPPFASEANALSEILTGVATSGAYPHAASVGNYRDLGNDEAPAKSLLGHGGQFVFGVVDYQPKFGSWEASKTIGVINRVVNRFFPGHPYFPDGVTGLVYDVHFDITATPRGRASSYDAATIQFGARLAASGLAAITPAGGGEFPGACSFHPGPGMLHVGYEVNKPTGRSTVPLVCVRDGGGGGGGGGGGQHLITIRGNKWCDAVVDHRFDAGDTPIAGVTIELRDGSCTGMLLDTAVTAADGSYTLMTVVDSGGDIDLFVVEDSTGAGQTLNAASWLQTTPQTDCGGSAITDDIFAVGTGIYREKLVNVTGDLEFDDRDFGNLQVGEVGERTPGFWCSQVTLEATGKGGSDPCHQVIAGCSGSVEARVNRAIAAWKTLYCPSGINRLVFDIFDANGDGYFDLAETSVILCPQVSEPFQFPRHLLALLLNVTDCPCVGASFCGNVGSPLCTGQPIVLGGRLATVHDALAAACAGTIGHEVLASINENRSTILYHCGL